jgi:hypothetical protein
MRLTRLQNRDREVGNSVSDCGAAELLTPYQGCAAKWWRAADEASLA